LCHWQPIQAATVPQPAGAVEAVRPDALTGILVTLQGCSEWLGCGKHVFLPE
jgi:hypothetical protein